MLNELKVRASGRTMAAAVDDELRRAVVAYLRGEIPHAQLDATVSLYNEVVFRLQRRLGLPVPLWEALVAAWVEAEEAGADPAEWRQRLGAVLARQTQSQSGGKPDPDPRPHHRATIVAGLAAAHGRGGIISGGAVFTYP